MIEPCGDILNGQCLVVAILFSILGEGIELCAFNLRIHGCWGK